MRRRVWSQKYFYVLKTVLPSYRKVPYLWDIDKKTLMSPELLRRAREVLSGLQVTRFDVDVYRFAYDWGMREIVVVAEIVLKNETEPLAQHVLIRPSSGDFTIVSLSIDVFSMGGEAGIDVSGDDFVLCHYGSCVVTWEGLNYTINSVESNDAVLYNEGVMVATPKGLVHYSLPTLVPSLIAEGSAKEIWKYEDCTVVGFESHVSLIDDNKVRAKIPAEAPHFAWTDCSLVAVVDRKGVRVIDLDKHEVLEAPGLAVDAVVAKGDQLIGLKMNKTLSVFPLSLRRIS